MSTLSPRVFPIVSVCGWAIALLACPSLAGAASRPGEKPLERMTPVPAGEIIPIVDFFRPPTFQRPRLNPAGTHFATLISTPEDTWDLVAVALGTGKIERLTGGKGYDVSSYHWLADDRLLFSVTRDKLYSTGLFAVELGRFNRSYVLQRYNAIVPVGFPEARPLHAIIWIKHKAADLGGDGGILEINTRRSFMTGEKDGRIYLSGDDGLRADVVRTYPTPKSGATVGYMTDIADELAFAFTAREGVKTLHRLADGKWEPCPVDLDEIEIVEVGDRPGELLVLAPPQEGQPRAVHLFDAVTGRLGAKVYQDDAYDLVDVSFYRHPVDRHILGVHYNRRGAHTVWFDKNYHVIHTVLQKSFPDRVVTIIGSDRAEEQFFIRVSSDVNPGTYFHVKLETKSFSRIDDMAPWIDPARMRPMKLIPYKSRDGRDLEGYVTLPEGATVETPAPLVVLPHGGPWARDSWGWDPEVQFLASRGFAVFQPNYRGSTGTAWRFPRENLWDFRAMHDDVTDGVRTVLRTRLIDPDRIAIMGWSFGAYLALCGAAYEPELYRCAVTLSGVYDWEQMVNESRGNIYARGGYGVLKRRLGDPKLEAEKFEEISPLRAVSNIRVPVFVAHGGADVVTSVNQSRRLIAALKRNDVPHEVKIESGEGHGFHKLDNKVELYAGIESFLGEHMAPRAAGAAE